MARAPRVRCCPSLLDLEREEDGPTLTMGAVALVLGLSQDMVRSMFLESKDIRSFRIGRNHKILWRSLRAYLFSSGALPLRAAERRRITVVVKHAST